MRDPVTAPMRAGEVELELLELADVDWKRGPCRRTLGAQGTGRRAERAILPALEAKRLDIILVVVAE